MMRALFRRVGVDYDQWRALVRALLRIDFGALYRSTRPPSARQSRWMEGASSARRLALGLLGVALIYGLSGISPAAIVLLGGEAFFAGTILATVVGFMLAQALLMGEGNGIVSATDHHVIGSRPVSSRTYLAVRVTTIMVRTAVVTTLVALPAVVSLAVTRSVALAAAALAVAWGTGVAVTLAVISVYAWLLRIAGPAKMLRYVSYLQFGVQFVVWGGFIIVSQGVAKRFIDGVSLTGTTWQWLYPGAWFGSYLRLAGGDFALGALLPALLSIVLIVGLASTVSGKVSLEYAENLAALSERATVVAKAAPARWLGLLSNETRAVAILVRSQIANDMKVRMGLMSLLPITVIYMFMGSRGGAPADPFMPSSGPSGNTGIIQLAVMFLPMTLRRVLITSDAYRASWIFHATPADRGRLVLSSRNLITLFFLVPYLLFLGALFAWGFKNIGHAAVHAFYVGLLAYIVLQFTVMISPKLPFSLPHGKDTEAGKTFGLTMGLMLFGTLAYYLITKLVYRSTVAMVVTAVGFILAAVVMDRVTRRRANAERWEIVEG